MSLSCPSFCSSHLEWGTIPTETRGRRSPPLAAAPQHLERGSNPGTLRWHPVEKNAPPQAQSRWPVSDVHAGREDSQPRSADPSPWAVQPVWTVSGGASSPVDCAHPYPNACWHNPKSIFLFFLRNQTKIIAVGFFVCVKKPWLNWWSSAIIDISQIKSSTFDRMWKAGTFLCITCTFLRLLRKFVNTRVRQIATSSDANGRVKAVQCFLWNILS